MIAPYELQCASSGSALFQEWNIWTKSRANMVMVHATQHESLNSLLIVLNLNSNG